MTDGAVSNTDEVINTIHALKNKHNIRTHTVGVGHGASHDLIKRGAQYGGGYHIFVMKEEELKQQIINLLSNIVIPSLENVELIYNKNIIKKINASFDKSITRGSISQMFIQF